MTILSVAHLMNRRPELSIVAPNASPEEAAAAVAALEQFMRATAPPPAPIEPGLGGWHQAALTEGVARADFQRDPWL